MTRLGVFGGSFDPPHRTHERVAKAALSQLDLDALLWIPAARSPHKPDRTLSDDTHRLAMLRDMVAGEPRFRIDTRELERGGTSWTVETLESLAAEYPNAELFLVVGSDNLAGFESWKAPERIVELATLVVYDRPGASVASSAALGTHPATSRRVIPLEGIRSNISSTAIRDALRDADPPREAAPSGSTDPGPLAHLDPRTLAYIREHGLYL